MSVDLPFETGFLGSRSIAVRVIRPRPGSRPGPAFPPLGEDMRTMQYTTENTEGYSAYDLANLNRIYEHRIALLDEDERENPDLLQYISEQVLYEYDVAQGYEGGRRG
jgi:hypothetical protein